MRKTCLFVALFAIWLLLGATPAMAQCGQIQSHTLDCCGNQVTVSACQSGYSPCREKFPGVFCGGTCWAADATDAFACIEGPSASNPPKALVARVLTLIVPTCNGELVAVEVETLVETAEQR